MSCVHAWRPPSSLHASLAALHLFMAACATHFCYAQCEDITHTRGRSFRLINGSTHIDNEVHHTYDTAGTIIEWKGYKIGHGVLPPHMRRCPSTQPDIACRVNAECWGLLHNLRCVRLFKMPLLFQVSNHVATMWQKQTVLPHVGMVMP
jgi:hypothetical protein